MSFEKGDIIARHRKHSNQNADYYMCLGEHHNWKGCYLLLGVRNNGEFTCTTGRSKDAIDDVYRKVGTYNLSMDIDKDVILTTQKIEGNKD